MAVEKQTVRTLTQPTIVLDDLQFLDTEEGTANAVGNPVTAYKPSKQHGSVFPLIQVNKFTFDPEQIVSLKLHSIGERPYIDVEILVKDKSFYSVAYPKDGDLVSVFIRGKVDPFKPIKNDYEITTVNIQSDSGGGELGYDTMRISGSLRIPGFDAVKCFSLKGTSYDAMMKVANQLKLGFATNETDTNDSQTWICPNEKVKNFLSDTAMAAWKDEKSFYDYFIDHYYILNFVNVESFYSEKPDIEDAIAILRMSHDHGKDSELATSTTKTVLSNWNDISQTQFYLLSHSLINNSSSVNFKHGYKRYVQYYDSLLKENQSIFVDPKTTEGAENDKQLLKGRPNENFYKEQINTKWMGVQYGADGENAHAKYHYAKVTNFQNNVHLTKMGLKVVMPNANFNLRRMQTVPVVIIIQKDIVRKAANLPKDESANASIPAVDEPNREKSELDIESTPFVVDRTITGFYTIHDITYIYEQGVFRQECTLLRREWATPPQV